MFKGKTIHHEVWNLDSSTLEDAAGTYLSAILSKRSMASVCTELHVDRKNVMRWEDGHAISRLAAINIILLCETSPKLQHWITLPPQPTAYYKRRDARE